MASLTLPKALLVQRIGGVTNAESDRKENFRLHAIRFLNGLAHMLELHTDDACRVQFLPGEKYSSGIARLQTPQLVVELSESAQRVGVEVHYFGVDPEGVQSTDRFSEPTLAMVPAGAVDDLAWRLRRLIAGDVASARPMPYVRKPSPLIPAHRLRSVVAAEGRAKPILQSATAVQGQADLFSRPNN